jgi:uncharacterized membrane protein (DUF4010 family)
LARIQHEAPEKLPICWQATVIANTMQFPRVLALLYAVNTDLARAAAPALLAMSAAGALLSAALLRVEKSVPPVAGMGLRNPFHLRPALKFGLLFSGILLLSKAAASALGTGAIYAVSALGGSVDADAVVLSASDLLRAGAVSAGAAQGAILLGLAANAVVKTVIAGYAGSTPLAVRLAAAFAVIFAAGAGAWWMGVRL